MIKFNSNKIELFWSSDIHGYHKNICFGTSNWNNKEDEGVCRKFNTPLEMTETIINNINSKTGENGHLFLLGDLLFHKKTPDDYINFIHRFSSNHIYLFIGNHDNTQNLQIAYEYLKDYKVEFLGDYLEIEVDNQMICMMHYPILQWNNRHKTSWNFYGHVHGNIPHTKHSLDVGLDYYYKLAEEYNCFSWFEIKDILK